MPVLEPTQLRQALPRGQRLLGLDVGVKTIGLALSDALLMTASPLHTIRRTKFGRDADALLGIVAERGVGGLVVGLPINMDGSEGPRCQSVRQFARDIAEPIPLPLLLWDERLSTAAVTRTLLEADMSRRKRGQVVDKMAAAYILQGALDALAGLARA